MSKLTGGCYCGAVRYEITHKPLLMFKCHCRACQKISGGPYTPVVLIATKSFRITQGALRHYATDSINGESNKRGFCEICGSRVTGAERDVPRDIMAVTASSLDDPSIFKPEYDIFVSHAQSWDLMDPALPKHPEHRIGISTVP